MAETTQWRDGHGDPTARGYRGYPPYNRVMTMVERGPFPPRLVELMEFVQAESRTPFKGITTDGNVIPGLYKLQETGFSTKPVKEAAEAFLDTLDDFYRPRAMFPIDAPQWRLWDNVGLRFNRHGMWFLQMSPEQLDAARRLLHTALGDHGFRLVEDIRFLNDYLYETTRHHHHEGGGLLYRLSVFGEPSLEAPWGFQMDGHHSIINYFVVGDQIVMTPRFFAAEPVEVDDGPRAGLKMFQPELEIALRLMRSLDPEQVAQARVVESILTTDFPRERHQGFDQHHLGGQGRDNWVIPYEGLGCAELTTEQRRILVELIEQYMRPMPPGHRELRVDEIKQHLDDTHFVWMGGFDDVAPFYYRIQSPVVMIEFDHQSGANYQYPEPNRFQAHTIVRTPNGNDYGRELLRQYRARRDGAAAQIRTNSQGRERGVERAPI
jgi:hypothetical protein